MNHKPRPATVNVLTAAQTKTLLARADALAYAGKSILPALLEFDMPRGSFYHLYAKVRGVKWTMNHPREFARRRSSRRNITGNAGYVKYIHLMQRGEWLGTPRQLNAYLKALERQG